jgi:hypothetical protein
MLPRPLALLAAALLPLRLAAQEVPGSELLRFPLGTVDRAAALESAVGDGLGNPAAIALAPDARLRVGAAALQTPSEQGVRGALLAAAGSLPGELTVGLSIARLTVDDLVRTEGDPTTVGDAIPYGTMLLSLGVARRTARYLIGGVAVRYRRGELDGTSDGALGVDFGVLADDLPVRDARVGLSTFLWRPGSRDVDPSTVNLAADLRVLGRDETHQLRAGYAFSTAGSRDREHLGLLSARSGIWEGRAGLARAEAYGGRDDWRTRLGVVVHHAPYAVGIAREENGDGLAAIWQFTLKATFP